MRNYAYYHHAALIENIPKKRANAADVRDGTDNASSSLLWYSCSCDIRVDDWSNRLQGSPSKPNLIFAHIQTRFTALARSQ